MKRKMAERRNKSDVADFDNTALTSPFAAGGFRFCAEGVYTEGNRKGKKAVCKWFKTGHVFESMFFDQDIRAMEKAVDLVAQWNKKGYVDQRIRVNIPEVWTFDSSDMFREGTKVLVEPFIKNYQKFNSNTGWVAPSTPWSEVLQALSHFTFHSSNGEFLLCDIQGGIESKGVVLTDPAIASRKKEFGVTDTGHKGISTFFSMHRCNKFCRRYWRVPHDRTLYLNPQQGTSMSSITTPSALRMPYEASYRARRLPLPTRLFFRHDGTSIDGVSRTRQDATTVLPLPTVLSARYGRHTPSLRTVSHPTAFISLMDPPAPRLTTTRYPTARNGMRLGVGKGGNRKSTFTTVLPPFHP